MRTDKAENQHYVPKMLLRNFAPDEAPEKVFVFDKHTQKVWPKPTSIKNVAAERAFYEFDFDDKYVASAEHVVEHVESNTRPAIERVLTTRTLKTLSDEEKSWLVVFATLQMLRGRAFREQALDMDKLLIEKDRLFRGRPQRCEELEALQGQKRAEALQHPLHAERAP